MHQNVCKKLQERMHRAIICMHGSRNRKKALQVKTQNRSNKIEKNIYLRILPMKCMIFVPQITEHKIFASDNCLRNKRAIK